MRANKARLARQTGKNIYLQSYLSKKSKTCFIFINNTTLKIRVVKIYFLINYVKKKYWFMVICAENLKK